MPINTGGSYDGSQDDEDNRPSGSSSPAASGSGTGRGPSTSGTGGGPSTSGTGGGPSTSGSSNGGYGGDFGGSGNFGGGIMGGDWGGVGSNEGIGSLGGDWGGSDHNWSGDFGGIGSAGGFGQLGPDVGGLGQDIGNGGGAPKGDFGAGADPRDFAMNHIMESMGVSLMDNANANAFSVRRPIWPSNRLPICRSVAAPLPRTIRGRKPWAAKPACMPIPPMVKSRLQATISPHRAIKTPTLSRLR